MGAEPKLDGLAETEQRELPLRQRQKFAWVQAEQLSGQERSRLGLVASKLKNRVQIQQSLS